MSGRTWAAERRAADEAEVADWPALTEAQVDRLSVLLHPARLRTAA